MDYVYCSALLPSSLPVSRAEVLGAFEDCTKLQAASLFFFARLHGLVCVQGRPGRAGLGGGRGPGAISVIGLCLRTGIV